MRVAVKRTVAGAFSASETFDVGVDLGSPVSFDYFDRAAVPIQREDRRGDRGPQIGAALPEVLAHPR